MKKAWERLRKWMIVKLGGYVKEPIPVVRYDRVTLPTRKVCAEGRFSIEAQPGNIKHIIAHELAKSLCDQGLMQYQYLQDPEDPQRLRRVRGTIRVIEPTLEGGWF